MLRAMGEGDLDVDGLERELEKLPEVRAARVVATQNRILEIHLVSDGSKPPKQLTRDVETVAATRGLDIDRRTISIAQMPEGTGNTLTDNLRLSSISVATEGTQSTCRVRVTRGDADGIGESSAPATSGGRARLVAQATIDAVSSLAGAKLPVDVHDAVIVDLGEHAIALAALVFVGEGGSESLQPGAHPVHGDADDAIARAVLDGINRHNGV